MTHTTNYTDTFIAVAPDTSVHKGVVPKEGAKLSTAARAFALVSKAPYRYTSDDLLFAVYAARTATAASARVSARKAFFAKPQACLRASDLCKRYGWGVHHDSEGRIALFAMESREYATFVAGKDLKGRPIVVKNAMRSTRK